MRAFSDETRKRMSEAAKRRCTDEWRKRKSKDQSTKLDYDKINHMYLEGKTQTEIAQELGVSQKVVWRFMKNNGIQARIAFKREQSGNKNDSWKGGKVTTEHGYIAVRMPEHPRASSNGYVLEHILVVEQKIGRPLAFHGVGNPKSEIVHHKNEIKSDNRPENLEVMTQSQHVKLHNELRRSRKGGGSNAKGKQNESA